MDVEQTNIPCCCLCQTSCSNNPHHCTPHCRAGTKPNALCPIHPGACRAAETGFGSECCIWLHKQLKFGSFLRPPLLQTQPLWSPSSSLHSPSWQGLLLSSLGLPSKQELKSCLCQAPVCSRVCRALYASTRLRCNESSINYCANNAH